MEPPFPDRSHARRLRRDIPGLHGSGFTPDRGSSIGIVETDGNTDRLIDSITASGFTVEEHTYPRNDHYSAQHWLDLVFTYSNHLILAEDKAAQLRVRLAERIGSRGVTVGGDTLLILATRSQQSG